MRHIRRGQTGGRLSTIAAKLGPLGIPNMPSTASQLLIVFPGRFLQIGFRLFVHPGSHSGGLSSVTKASGCSLGAPTRRPGPPCPATSRPAPPCPAAPWFAAPPRAWYVWVLGSEGFIPLLPQDLSSPKPGHTTSGSGRGARRGGGAGSGRTGCQQNCSPRRQGTLVPSKASKTRRLKVTPEARTSEIKFKPSLSNPKPGHTTGGSGRGAR